MGIRKETTAHLLVSCQSRNKALCQRAITRRSRSVTQLSSFSPQRTSLSICTINPLVTICPPFVNTIFMRTTPMMVRFLVQTNIFQLIEMNADGMPPLVDNPTSMTFTFFTDMTPITALSVDPSVPCEGAWDNPAPAFPVDFTESEYPQTNQTADRVSHGKKRDASYIPRPPNAFILFRSSFIRSQQVPEKVEGNHSTLSKIIGSFLFARFSQY